MEQQINSPRWSPEYFLLAWPVIILPIIMAGGARPWLWSFVAGVFIASFAILLWSSRLTIPKSDIKKSLFFILPILLYSFFQAIPLPMSVVAFFSPQRAWWLQRAHELSGGAYSAATISYTPTDTLFSGLWLLTLALFALTLHGFMRKDASQFRNFFLLIFAIAGFEALYGLFQVFILIIGSKGYTECATGTFPNRNHFAAFLGMIWPLQLAWLLTFSSEKQLHGHTTYDEKSRRQMGREKQFFFMFLPGLVLLGLVFSQSRGGILGALIGTTVLVLWGGKRCRSIVPFVAGCWVIAVAYGSFIGFEGILERFTRVEDDAAGRLKIWQATFDMIRDHWLTGTGLGTYDHVSLLYQVFDTDLDKIGDAHNDYLQITAEWGIPFGCLVIALVWGYWLTTATRLVRTDSAIDSQQDGESEERLFRVGALAGSAAFLFHNWVEFNWQIASNQLYFVVLLVLMKYKGPPPDPLQAGLRESIPSEEVSTTQGMPNALRVLFSTSLGLIGIVALLIMIDCIKSGDNLPLIAVFALMALGSFRAAMALVKGFRGIRLKTIISRGAGKDTHGRRSHGLSELHEQLQKQFEPIKSVARMLKKESESPSHMISDKVAESSGLKRHDEFIRGSEYVGDDEVLSTSTKPASGAKMENWKRLIEAQTSEFEALVLENEKLTNSLETLRRENASLHDEHNESALKCASFEQSLAAEKSEFEALLLENGKLTNSMETLKREYASLQNEHKESALKFASLEQSLTAEKEERGSLKGKYETLEQESKSLNKEFSSLKREHERMEQVCKDFERESELSVELKDHLEIVKREKGILKESNDSLLAQLTDTRRELDTLSNQYENLARNHQDLKTSYSSREEISQAEGENLAVLQKQYDLLYSAYEREKQESLSLKDELNSLNQEYERLEQMFQSLKFKSGPPAGILDQLGSLQNENERLKQNNSSLLAQLESFRIELADAQHEYDSLSQKHSELLLQPPVKERTAMEEDIIAGLKEKYESLLDQYERAMLESRSLADELKLLNQEHDKMKQVCNALESEVESSADLQSQVVTLRDVIAGLKEKYESLLDQYERAMLESRSLADELKLLNQEHDKMKQVCDALGSEVESSADIQSQVATLRHEIGSLKESNSSLASQLSESQRELTALRKDPAAAQTRDEDLQVLERKYESLLETYERAKLEYGNAADKLSAQNEEIESLRAEYQKLSASHDSLQEICESLAECVLEAEKAGVREKK